MQGPHHWPRSLQEAGIAASIANNEVIIPGPSGVCERRVSRVLHAGASWAWEQGHPVHPGCSCKDLGWRARPTWAAGPWRQASAGGKWLWTAPPRLHPHSRRNQCRRSVASAHRKGAAADVPCWQHMVDLQRPLPDEIHFIWSSRYSTLLSCAEVYARKPAHVVV